MGKAKLSMLFHQMTALGSRVSFWFSSVLIKSPVLVPGVKAFSVVRESTLVLRERPTLWKSVKHPQPSWQAPPRLRSSRSPSVPTLRDTSYLLAKQMEHRADPMALLA